MRVCVCVCVVVCVCARARESVYDACQGLLCKRIPRTSAVFIILCIITLTRPIQTVQFFTLCPVAAASTLLAHSVVAAVVG